MHRKYAASSADGVARGFATPSRKIELYSETFLEHGYPPLPDFGAQVDRRSELDRPAQYPLVLTTAKSMAFCESQHRGLPTLRRLAPDPEIEVHPDTAAARGIRTGDWVQIETVWGHARARAKFNAELDPHVVYGQHGWWEACEEIGAAGYDAFGADTANLNVIIRHDPADPISGSVPHRAYPCNVTRWDPPG